MKSKLNKKDEQQIIKNMSKKQKYEYQKLQDKDKKEFLNTLLQVAVTQDFESEFKDD